MNSIRIKLRRSHIGVDVATTAVRAVEIRGTNKIRTLATISEEPLAPGAVVDGEISDPQEVGRALTALFRDARFSTRDVRAGLAGKRMIVRQIEMPMMPEVELKRAVGFAASEHIPFAPQDSVMDYQITSHTASTQSLVVAAAERHAVASLVDALQFAKLEPLSIELNAWASARASAPALLGAGPSAVIDVGASTADVVITDGGMVKFLRVLEAPQASDSKRKSAFGNLDKFVSDVSETISFYLQRSGDDRVERVVLAGGQSMINGLAERLEIATGAKVSGTDWAKRLPFSDLDPDSPRARSFTVAVGLALGGVEN